MAWVGSIRLARVGLGCVLFAWDTWSWLGRAGVGWVSLGLAVFLRAGLILLAVCWPCWDQLAWLGLTLLGYLGLACVLGRPAVGWE